MAINFNQQDFGRIQEPAQVANQSRPVSLEGAARLHAAQSANLEQFSKLSKSLTSAVAKTGFSVVEEIKNQEEMREKYDEAIGAVGNAKEVLQSQGFDVGEVEKVLMKSQKQLQDQGVYKAYENLFAISNNGKHRAAAQLDALQTALQDTLDADTNLAPGLAPDLDKSFDDTLTGLQGQVVGEDSFGNPIAFGGDAGSDIAEYVSLSYGLTAARQAYKQNADKVKTQKMEESLAVQQITEAEYALNQLTVTDPTEGRDPIKQHFEKFYDLGGKNLNANFFAGLNNWLDLQLADPTLTQERIVEIGQVIDRLKNAEIRDGHKLIAPNSENEVRLDQTWTKFLKRYQDLDEAVREQTGDTIEAAQNAIITNTLQAAYENRGDLTPGRVEALKRNAIEQYITLGGDNPDEFIGKFDASLKLIVDNEPSDSEQKRTFELFFVGVETEYAPDNLQQMKGNAIELLKSGQISYEQYNKLSSRIDEKLETTPSVFVENWKFDPEDFEKSAEDTLRLNDRRVPFLDQFGSVAGYETQGSEDNVLPPNELQKIVTFGADLSRKALQGGTISLRNEFSDEDRAALKEMGYPEEVIRFGGQPLELTLEPIAEDATPAQVEERQRQIEEYQRMYSTNLALRYSLRRKAVLDELERLSKEKAMM